MKTLRLAICDNDRTYCNRLDDYLRSHLNLSFDIVSFTETKILLDFAREHAIALLMISESLFLSLENKLEKGLFSNILIMDETPQGMIAEPKILSDVHIDHVSKYQAASGLVNGIIDFCAETPEDFESVSSHAKLGKSRIIGLYSPVTKSGQTTFSVEMAKAIAREKNKKVIFLSFESFSSLPALLEGDCDENITDLLYYADCEKSKFGLYLEKIKRHRDGVDFIMPAKTAIQVKEISFEKIRELMELLADKAGYEYVVLDLTEYPEGFFDILSMCDHIITVCGKSTADAERIRAYDMVLRENLFSEIETKTIKVQLPDIRDKKAYNSLVSELIERTL